MPTYHDGQARTIWSDLSLKNAICLNDSTPHVSLSILVIVRFVEERLWCIFGHFFCFSVFSSSWSSTTHETERGTSFDCRFVENWQKYLFPPSFVSIFCLRIYSMNFKQIVFFLWISESEIQTYRLTYKISCSGGTALLLIVQWKSGVWLNIKKSYANAYQHKCVVHVVKFNFFNYLKFLKVWLVPVLVLGARHNSILRSGTKFGSSRHTSRAASHLRPQWETFWKFALVICTKPDVNYIWLICYCWGNSSIPEGRFSKWF